MDWQPRGILEVVSKPFLIFYLPVQLNKILRPFIFNTALDGYNPRRTVDGTHAAADAPVRIHPGFIVKHLYRIYRTDIGAGPAANAFVQFGFANKIDRH